MWGRYVAGAALGILLLAGAGCGDDDDPAQPAPEPRVHLFTSADFIANTFYHLDLPADLGLPVSDTPGRDPAQQRIEPGSTRIYKLRSLDGGVPLGPGDITNVAAYLDTTGVFWSGEGAPENDWQTPYIHGAIWTELDFELLYLTMDGRNWGLALDESVEAEDILAVVYRVEGLWGFPEYRVGDNPYEGDQPGTLLPGQPDPFYRMKLVKAPASAGEGHAFFHEMRNIYSLGQIYIHPPDFELHLERGGGSTSADVDENGLTYLQLFGLDLMNSQGVPGPDGQLDIADALRVDLARGLLKFPEIMPFAAGEAVHRVYAGDQTFQWEGTYLADHQAPQLYDPATLPGDLPVHGHFTFRAIFHPYSGD
jgi:hypothetical protein